MLPQSTHEIIVVILAVEWWLGTQKWIRAKSTIGLIVLLVTVLVLGLIGLVRKGKTTIPKEEP